MAEIGDGHIDLSEGVNVGNVVMASDLPAVRSQPVVPL